MNLNLKKCKFIISALCILGDDFNWSSPEFASQASHTNCKPLKKHENAAMKANINPNNINRTSLGAVDNAEVHNCRYYTRIHV